MSSPQIFYPTPGTTPPNGIVNAGFNAFQPITVLVSTRAVIADRVTPATIVVSNRTGKITSVTPSILPCTEFAPGTPYYNYSPYLLMPGLVDAHVHLNEPGRTEWEGFWTGTQAAAFGGVTTVIDMPLNAIPPTTTVAGFDEKLQAAKGKCWVDVGFYGGIIPGNAHELKSLVRKGVRGFKGFLIESGVEEFPAVSTEDIAKAMRELYDESTTLMFHAEMVPDAGHAQVQPPAGPPASYQSFLDSRPSEFETCAIAEIISLAHLAPNLPLHIVHLSAVEAIPMLRQARNQGIHITAETCFHYLSLAAEEIQHGDTRHKCCPPIRTQKNQDGLWSELLRPNDSVIKTVVSDHSPCTPNLKLLPPHLTSETNPYGQDDAGDFFSAWGGISSVGLGLPILYTECLRRNTTDEGVDMLALVRWCCANTAKQVGLEHCKGALAVGMDADIAVFDEEAEFTVQPSTMLFRNKCSPYEGKKLQGVVRESWVRGQKVFDRTAPGFGFNEKIGPQGMLLVEPRMSKIVQ